MVGLVAVAVWGVALGLAYRLRTTDTLYAPLRQQGQEYQIYSYDDRLEGGASSNLLREDSSGLHYDWRLNGQLAYPYIGGGVSWLRPGKPCVDWRAYDSLLVRWRLTGKGIARLALHNLDPVRSDRKDPNSLRILMVVVPVDSAWQMNRLAFKDWTTPPWWYSQHRIAPNSEDRFMDQVCELEWDVPGAAGKDAQGRLEISRIELGRPARGVFWFLLALGPLSAILALLGHNMRRPDTPETSIRPEPSLTRNIPVQIPRQNDWMLLEQYLKEHYQDAELGAEFLCRHFGWNATKFTALVKAGAGMNFKQALNRIRISAGCTLLRESTEPVSTISDRVGFSNVTHFNRVFKEIQGMSPSEYREGK